MSKDDDNADVWENYESGPFCRHWGDPTDCDETCTTCGHGCTAHAIGLSTACDVENCVCEAWLE